ncbi:hypothetical protein MYSE111917_16585 [Mycobacterium senriense]|uniref:SinR family protein n=1 Tax=Mycobacterium senriense TaxID=2775496 RepID=A0ABN6ILW8_9MYCO|nr:hypothetical protein [Mycobacterium senriense]BCZ24860.1 hypothetical protein MTY59_47150 [Mycobacterium senriense]
MSGYIVSYDLSAPGRDYASLFSYLKSFPYHAHLLESSWAIITDKSAMEVCNEILAHIDSNDHVMVNEVTRNTAWFGLPAPVSEWLQKYLPAVATT